MAEEWRLQAAGLWSLMDELSERSPAAYRAFVGEQLRAGAEFHAAPELHASLRTEVLEPERESLYINICGWKRVPAPRDPGQPLPVYAGSPERVEVQERCAVLDVAFNPAVLQDAKDTSGMRELCTLALGFVQQQQGVRISPQYSVVKPGPESEPEALHRRLGFQQLTNVAKLPEQVRAPVSQTPAALLQQLTSLRRQEQDEDIAARAAAPRSKAGLIQVVSSTYAAPRRPEHHLEVQTDGAGVPRRVELTVELPKICSVSDCRLSVSKEDVLVEAEDIYYLLLEFPEPVNEETAAAVFHKQTRRLILRVEVL